MFNRHVQSTSNANHSGIKSLAVEGSIKGLPTGQTRAPGLAPFQSPGPVFWLAVDLVRAFPWNLHSGVLRSCLAYSSGGCVGMAGEPASPTSRFTL